MAYSDAIVTFDTEAAPYQDAILADFNALYATPTGQALLDKLSLNGGTINVVGLSASLAQSTGSPAFGGAPDATGVATLTINYDLAGQVWWFNDMGELVKGSTELVIAHELSHMADSTTDPLDVVTVGGKQAYAQPTDKEMNAATFDFAGGAVRAQNTVADELGVSDQRRVSYIGATFPGVTSGFVGNVSYTDNKKIDVVRFGDQRGVVQNNKINHNARSDNSSDLIFGFGGNDTIAGGGGNDFIYGGDGVDTLSGGLGDDTLYGEQGDDKLVGNRGVDLLDGGYNSAVSSSDLSSDGLDTADYGNFNVGASGKGVVIAVTDTPISTVYQSNSDFAHAVFVTDLVRDKATDTLISVETINATTGDDILQIDTLNSARLAGSNGQGGLADIDLGAETKTTKNKGDLVDLSKLDEAALVRCNADGTVYVDAKADTTRELIVSGAEHVKGGAGNDLFKMEGTGATIDFGKGGGHDLVETDALNGEYNLKLSGLNPDDVTLIAGGEELYYSYNVYGDVYEFIGFQINETGETIIFVDKNKEIGVGHDPNGPYGMAAGLQSTPISSVEFADGTIWDASQIWAAAGDGEHGDSGNGLVATDHPQYTIGQYYPTSVQDYIDNINANYFQADPISAPSSASSQALREAQQSFVQTETATINASLIVSMRPIDRGMPLSKVDLGRTNSFGHALKGSIVPPYAAALDTMESGRSASNNGLSPDLSGDDTMLSDAVHLLRNYNASRASSLSASIDPTANLVGYQQGPRSGLGTAPAVDAGGSSHLHKLIEVMAAFDAGGGMGTLDTSAMRQREFGSHALTLAVAH